MTEPNSPITDSPRISRAAQIGWGILICVTLYVCYFSHLGAIGFVGPDEPRYAWIARDMMETGDWVTPRLYGRPWFEKPPLFYWGAALSFKIFGVSEAAARLPSAVCALLATLALAWLALRFYGAETARWLLLLLPTTVGMIGFSHAAATDMPFSGMLTIAMVCVAVILGLTRNENTPILPRTSWLASVLFGFFLGLAVLAKGPAAIVLCGGAVFFWALFTKRWRDALRLLHPATIASFCLTALPWYVLCARRNPDFFRLFIIEHNFKRYLTPEFQHVQPFWFYLPVLLVGLLPWTALFLWSSIHGATQLGHTRSAKEHTWFLVCWAGFCLAFFSVSQSKLPGYVLPAVPATVLLLSNVTSLSFLAPRRSLSATSVATGVGFGICGFLFSHSFIQLSQRYDSLKFLLAFIFYGLGICILLLGLSFLSVLPPSARNVLVSSSVAVTLALIGNSKMVLGRTNLTSMSSDWLARELRLDSIPVNRLRVFRVPRSSHYGLNYYLHQEVQDWETERVEDGYVLTDGNTCDRLQTQQGCVDLWVRRDFWSGSWALLRVTPDLSMQGSRGGEHVQKKE